MNYSEYTRHKLSIFTALIVVLICGIAFVGCSTKRNTWLSRSYQRLSSHYNVYFNGMEAYDSGISSIRKKYNNDYSHVLPVYEFSDARAAKAGQGDMETALKKAHKLVQLHSITVKPERKEGTLTDEEKRFRAKEEFNPYVPEGYLLMGKANVVIHEEDEAIKYFDYLSRKHEGERPTYEGKIWKAIAYAQIGQYNNAMAALKSYDMDGVAPTELYADYQAAYANIYISQGMYREAIPYMEHAAAEVKDRHCRRRYNYILAQLYRAIGDKAKAAPIFLKLSKGVQDYDMAFAAKLDLATVATSEEERIKAEKSLQKMVKDVKLEDKLDQIYYAMGNLQMNEGDKAGAVVSYTKSAEASVSNDNQKGLSYLALADIYQAEPQYIEASTALDSASTYLDESNERKKEATDRANLLAPLARELRTIRDNDSVMAIARMDAKSRDKLLDKMVKEDSDRRKAEQEAREAEQEYAMSQSDYYQVSSSQNSSTASWYFYNNQLVSAGKSTFRTKWGNRKNEDDWRRSDKSSTSNFGATENDEDDDAVEALAEELTAREGDAPLSREKLLAGLPLTEEAQKKNDRATADAFLKSASILYDDLEDYERCIEQLEEMLRRYPNDKNTYDGLTLLHFAQGKVGDTNGQARTDQQIINKFPNSLMAQNLTQPSFLDNRQAEHDAVEQRYKNTYAAYIGNSFAQAIGSATSALNDTATEKEYKPKYLLVRALAQAKTGNATDFRSDLESIGKDYAGTPQDSVAKLLLAELDKGRMPVRHSDYSSPLDEYNTNQGYGVTSEKVEYAYEPDSAHIIVCIVDNGKLKEAQFRIADYNFGHYILEDYDLEMRGLPRGLQAIVIRPFKDKKEASTYYYSLREQTFWKEISSDAIPQIYMMSKQNYALMGLSGVDESFLNFINEYYKK